MPVEFNPDFVARMIPKVEWAALLEAADNVRTLPLPVHTLWGVVSPQPFALGQGRGRPEII